MAITTIYKCDHCGTKYESDVTTAARPGWRYWEGELTCESCTPILEAMESKLQEEFEGKRTANREKFFNSSNGVSKD